MTRTLGCQTKHEWRAITDIPLDDEQAALVHAQGFWTAPETGNRDGLVRVQATVVCARCGADYTPRAGNGPTKGDG